MQTRRVGPDFVVAQLAAPQSFRHFERSETSASPSVFWEEKSVFVFFVTQPDPVE